MWIDENSEIKENYDCRDRVYRILKQYKIQTKAGWISASYSIRIKAIDRRFTEDCNICDRIPRFHVSLMQYRLYNLRIKRYPGNTINFKHF